MLLLLLDVGDISYYSAGELAVHVGRDLKLSLDLNLNLPSTAPPSVHCYHPNSALPPSYILLLHLLNLMSGVVTAFSY